jgi:hypothetical protein
MGSRSSDRCPNSFLDEHLVIKSSLAGIDENELWICNTQLSVSNLDNFPGVSMMNRSVFLSLAAGLLASLAFAAPSQASTQAVTTSFAAAVGTATDIEITFTGAVSAVTLGPTTPGMTSSFSGDVVTLTFAPSASATAELVVTSAGFGTSPINVSGQSAGFVLSSAAVAYTTVVPEPTSIALLGIGMTGFLAFRRFFKRTAVA